MFGLLSRHMLLRMAQEVVTAHIFSHSSWWGRSIYTCSSKDGPSQESLILTYCHQPLLLLSAGLWNLRGIYTSWTVDNPLAIFSLSQASGTYACIFQIPDPIRGAAARDLEGLSYLGLRRSVFILGVAEPQQSGGQSIFKAQGSASYSQ